MMGTDTDDPIKDVLNEQEDVKEYRKENVVFGNKSDLTDTKEKHWKQEMRLCIRL